MLSLLNEFKKFVMRGNVLDLAVAVVLGVAFNAVVQSLVDYILMPLLGAAVGEPSFDRLTLAVGDGVVLYGAFITQLVNFVVIAFALFVVVKTFEQLQTLRKRDVAQDTPAPSDEAVLLAEIRDLLRAPR